MGTVSSVLIRCHIQRQTSSVPSFFPFLLFIPARCMAEAAMTAEPVSSFSPELLWSESASTQHTFERLRLMDEALLSSCSILSTMRLDTPDTFQASTPSTPLSCTILEIPWATTTQTLKHKHFIADIHPTLSQINLVERQSCLSHQPARRSTFWPSPSQEE